MEKPRDRSKFFLTSLASIHWPFSKISLYKDADAGTAVLE